MSDVPSSILEAARELFLSQGFSQTTIQELANHVGISKGAVYLHFRSKSDVMVALIRDLEDGILGAIRAIADREDLTPREKLREQLYFQFADVREQRMLYEIYIKDSGVAVNEELTLMAQKSRIDWQNVQEDFVSAAFPDHDRRFTTDIAVSLNGALNEYYSYVVLEGVELEPNRVADLLVELAEALAERLSSPGLQPVLDKKDLPGHAELEARIQEVSDERIEGARSEMEDLAAAAGPKETQEILETTEAIRHALAQNTRSRVVLQGLIANLREHKSIVSQRKTLAYELGLKLI